MDGHFHPIDENNLGSFFDFEPLQFQASLRLRTADSGPSESCIFSQTEEGAIITEPFPIVLSPKRRDPKKNIEEDQVKKRSKLISIWASALLEMVNWSRPENQVCRGLPSETMATMPSVC